VTDNNILLPARRFTSPPKSCPIPISRTP
jgi:hypothetical protein